MVIRFSARYFLRGITSFLLAAYAPIAQPAMAADIDRPNIVFILADDVGREALNCYGGTSYPTPHLDRLASEGARFEHCYAMPVCHPTRMCLLTGRYPRTLGNPAWGTFPPELETQTFAHTLKNAGYATAIAGKWQICMMKDDPQHPRRLGFDEWSLFGWHEGARYYSPMIYENGRLREDTQGRYGPDLYVDFLTDFIERNRHRPFFVYYSMALCHAVTDDLDEPVPYGPRGRYDNFAEMVQQMDIEIGRLIAAIDRRGLRESTLILFTTDNGSPKRSIIRAENGQYITEPVISKFQGRDIPGGKGDLTDWGTRVPMIASWKSVIEPGRVWNDLIDFSDVLPTFAELSGGPLPRGVQLDGLSFAKRLTSGQLAPRTWVYSEGRGGRYFTKTRRWKLYNNADFYDTKSDPDEQAPLDRQALSSDASNAYRLLESAMAKLQPPPKTDAH